MKKLNLDFIGEFAKKDYSGNVVHFWGKFRENPSNYVDPYIERYVKYTKDRSNLIEALPFDQKRPSKKYFHCIAFTAIPNRYLYNKEFNLNETNFQEFLEDNKQYIYIHQDEEGNNPQYFPVVKLTGQSTVHGKFARQC